MKHPTSAQVTLVSSLVLLATSLASTQAQLHKFQSSDPLVGKQIVAAGGRLVADYGSFQIYEAAQPLPAGLGGNVEARDGYNSIFLNAKTLDTTSPEVKALRTTAGNFAGKRLHLVQFAGPVQPAWLDQLIASGVEIVTYIPENAYIVYGGAVAISQVQSLAAAAPQIQWEGAFLDEYKAHPSANPLDANGTLRQLPGDEFAIQLVASEANAATLALLDQLKLAPMRRQHRVLNYLNVVVRLTPESVLRVMGQSDVLSIHAYVEPTLFCERQNQIIAGNLNGNQPSGPGYLAWLTSKGFTQAQFTSAAFAVDVTDSGLDNATTSPNHPGLYVSGNRSNPSRVAYARLEGFPGPGSTNSGCDGHGTINGHIVGGFNDAPLGFPHTDTNGFHYGLGVCPWVRVGSSVIFDPGYTDPDYTDLQSRAYRDGSRVSNNSWGANLGGEYDFAAQEYDMLVRDAQPASAAVPGAGNQEMVIVFANGNAGPSAGSVGSPASAKNVISVGAAKNYHPFGTDECGWSSAAANNANDMIGFSSRGPCDDGRRKPEIVAPGTHVSGGVAQAPNGGPNGLADPCFDGSSVCGGVGSVFFPSGQQLYTTSTGTSHSAPAVAGGCALIRQYFVNTFSSIPSPAMTKAFLMNSARYMTGAGANDTLPSNNQGIGEMNLGTAFDGLPRILRDQLAVDMFTASGQTRTFGATIANTNEAFRVTLAWTDAPGNTAGNAFNNNLDLTVTIGTNVYRGNVFNRALSVVGGTADSRNNSESVFLPAGTAGDIIVRVTATSINSDGVPGNSSPIDQDFALVIYNAAIVPAAITAQPESQTVLAGTNVAFTIGTRGTPPLSYQWRFNGSSLPGATNSTLTLLNVQTNQAGAYSVVVSNLTGSATSSVAVLTVLFLAPTFVAEPTNQVAAIGDTVVFNSSAVGSLPISYQWFFGGAPIAGATSNNLVLVDLRTNHAGVYSVVASNGAGTLPSQSASLTVVPRIPIKGWGNNDFGQVSISFSLSNAVDIAAGGYHSLAILKDGSVAAWGDNFDGQCDVPPGITKALGIAGGGYHSLAVRGDGTVAAWGASLYGQTNVPPDATNVVAVAAGAWHSVALRADGSVVAWGDNSRGQTTIPPSATNIISIAAGGEHNVALRSDGTVVCWGNNLAAGGGVGGQVDVPWTLHNVVAVAAGDFHSLALLFDGTVVGWGDNVQGQSVPPDGLTHVVAIAAGGAHSLAIREGGVVVAWGDNLYSQSIPLNLTGISEVAAGSYHSVVLLDQVQIPLQLQGVAWQGNRPTIVVPTRPSKTYFLLYKDSVTGLDWTFLTGIAGNGNVRGVTDSSATGSQRFYRVREQ